MPPPAKASKSDGIPQKKFSMILSPFYYFENFSLAKHGPLVIYKKWT